MLPRFSSTHSRQDSEDSALNAKARQYTSATRTRGTGRMLVSELQQAYGIAPSVVHQVEVTQTVEIQTDDASIAEKSSIPYPNSRTDSDSHHSVNSREVEMPDFSIGRAI